MTPAPDPASFPQAASSRPQEKFKSEWQLPSCTNLPGLNTDQPLSLEREGQGGGEGRFAAGLKQGGGAGRGDSCREEPAPGRNSRQGRAARLASPRPRLFHKAALLS